MIALLLVAASAALQSLAPGESTVVTVRARKAWNHTGVLLQQGGTYWLEVLAEKNCWTDFFICTGASGFDRPHLNRFRRMRRVPDAKWFALICTLDRRKTEYFVIGTGRVYQPPDDGELVCFANDVCCMYWNNWGSIRLRISRVE